MTKKLTKDELKKLITEVLNVRGQLNAPNGGTTNTAGVKDISTMPLAAIVMRLASPDSSLSIHTNQRAKVKNWVAKKLLALNPDKKDTIIKIISMVDDMESDALSSPDIGSEEEGEINNRFSFEVNQLKGLLRSIRTR